ncbi:MAG: DUF2141 domain-containing protein [Sphingomonadales bacterium]|nr:DUF2141 domain-containing protein [Sphingomonadales bacterium]
MSLPRRLHPAAAIACVVAGVAALALPTAAPADAPAGAPPGCTGPASATWLNVTVDGVRSSRGLMAVTLYADNPRKFLVKHGSLYVGRSNAQAGVTHTCIFVPQPGIYALALYHDENANQKFDRSTIGFPEEGFGFSNNPSTLAGLPTFRSVRLAVPRAGLSTRVQMKYP